MNATHLPGSDGTHLFQELGRCSDPHEATAFWALHRDTLHGRRMILATRGQSHLGLPTKQDFGEGGVLRSLFAHDGLTFLDGNTLADMDAAGMARIPVSHTVMFDLNAVNYVAALLDGKNAAALRPMTRALEYLIRNGFNYDASLYFLENTDDPMSDAKKDKMFQSMVAWKTLTNIDEPSVAVGHGQNCAKSWTNSMLHLVPDSTEAPRMRQVFNLQTRLIEALCAEPAGKVVDLAWLQDAWREIDRDWVRRFWENHTGQRQPWLRTIAAALPAEKVEILAIMREQHEFRLLYDSLAVLHVREVDWDSTLVMKAVRSLLRDFYAPCLYSTFSFRLPEGAAQVDFDKDRFLVGFTPLNICPYCDTLLQTDELDHFLPKDSFPFLSCHPDNLVPSCHDSNRVGHKGDTVPLDWREPEQAANYFHPKWRPGRSVLQVSFHETADRQLAIDLTAASEVDKRRVANMDRLVKLTPFWSRHVEGAFRRIGERIETHLRREGTEPSDTAVKKCLLLHRDFLKVGEDSLAIPLRALHAHMVACPAIVNEVTAQCREARAAYEAGLS